MQLSTNRRRIAVILVAVVGIVAVLCIAVTAFFVISGRTSPLESIALQIRLRMAGDALNKPAGTDATPFCFVVNAGENAATIANRLKAQGVILDADLFSTYLRYFNLDSKLQAATYSLKRNLTIPQVAHVLTNPEESLITLRIIEGWRAEEIAALLDKTPGLIFKGADFLALVSSSSPREASVQEFAARNGIPQGRSLEGFLYPATYTHPACGTAQSFLDQMLNAFDRYVTAQMYADTRAKSMTMYQMVTMASIIEREAVVEQERPTIASVYWNRYTNGISANPNPNVPTTLDADPTIQYALGDTRTPGTWWPRITANDYRGVNSPYNTYLNVGLPPGPIANPRVSSIQAAIYPAQTNYIYFRASCAADGTHQFAATFDEQLANACS
ncbi:MAG: endolytic transglycosylase MltG [Anaerolineae bacterium]|nr:endolytic transglycosylase MltG [Anaerolineae bacterium]